MIALHLCPVCIETVLVALGSMFVCMPWIGRQVNSFLQRKGFVFPSRLRGRCQNSCCTSQEDSGNDQPTDLDAMFEAQLRRGQAAYMKGDEDDQPQTS